jgi:hypothetical protein
MNIKSLISKLRYKKVFNEIYKNYLLEDKTSKAQEYDCKFYGAWNDLKRLEHVDSDDLEVNESIIELTEIKEEGSKYIDVHLLHEPTQATYALDFLPWEPLFKKNIKTDLELTEAEIMCHIFWEITFWGWSSKNVQRSGELIDEESEKCDIDNLN